MRKECVGKMLSPMNVAMCAALGFSTAFGATAVQYSFTPTTGGSRPDQALEWTQEGNWNVSGYPNATAALAILGSQPASAYVKMPDTLTIGGIQASKAIYLLGETVRINSDGYVKPAAPYDCQAGRIRGNDSIYVYADIEAVKDISGMWCCCGDINVPGEDTLSIGAQYWYGNRYANTADELRPNAFTFGSLLQSNGSLFFTAPTGCDLHSNAWTQVEGSPFLMLKDAAIGQIAPGCRVSGAGIPEGTFLRRYFPGVNMIELSQPVTASADSNLVTFAAYSPRTYGYVKSFNVARDSNRQVGVGKLRAGDVFEVTVDSMASAANYTATFTPPCNYPATLVVSNATSCLGTVRLKSCVLDFPSQPANGYAAFPKAKEVRCEDALATIGIRENVQGLITNFTGMAKTGNVYGSLKKTGAGTLTLQNNAATASYAGDVNVDGGTLVVESRRGESLTTLSSVTIAADAKLVLTGGVFAITALSVTAGAEIQAAEGAMVDLTGFPTLPAGLILSGPGRFKVAMASSIDGVTLQDMPVILSDRSGTAADVVEVADVVPGVPGNPAFWVQATSNVTARVYNATEIYDNLDYSVDKVDWTFVDCWRDCRETPEGDWRCPYYATNDWSELTVKDGIPARVRTIGGRTAIHSDGFSKGGANNYRMTQSGMVWNREIQNIRAVYHVFYDASSYGQAVLGSTKRNAESAKKYFLRAVNGTTDGGGIGSPHKAFVLAAGANSAAKNGEIYVNGVAKLWNQCAYVNGIALYELHPASPCAADAFAIQEDNGVTCSGCQVSYECIVYTNELSIVEKKQVRAYLLKKYRNVLPDVDITESRFNGGASAESFAGRRAVVEVEAGKVLGVSGEATGTIGKSGAGTLYLDNVNGADLDVREGELVVRSTTLTEDVIQPGAFIHLDATATNTMTLTKNVTYPAEGVTHDEVTYWRDKSGESSVVAQRRSTDGRYRGGYLAYPPALGGKPVVDYGIITNVYDTNLNYGAGPFHDFVWQTTTVGQAMKYTNTTTIADVFMMIGSRNGGGVPLGHFDHSSWRAATADPSVAFFGPSAPGNLRTASAWFDGVKSDPTTTGLNGGYQVVSVRNVNGSEIQFRTMMCSYSRRLAGGGELGEMLVYEKPLTLLQHQKIDAWLGMKWFDRRPPAFVPAIAGDVRVAAGATLTVEGSEPLTVSSISGEGTIDGTVKLTAGAELFAVINDDGTITPAAITGDVDLSAGGTVHLVGDTAKLAKGDYTLLTVAGDVVRGEWTCDAMFAKACKTVVRFEGHALKLGLLDSATVLIFR